MGVEELSSHVARNDRGVLLRSVDRETIRVEYQGRTLDLSVDRAPGSYGYYIPNDPFWSDGTAISTETMDLIKDSIVEISRHQRTKIEFSINDEWVTPD